MSTVKEWFTGLGARRTPRDPTGWKHRVTFWVLIVAFISPLVTPATEASAAPICRGPISGKSPAAAGFGDHYVKVTANRWCGSTGSGARWDGGAPSFDRIYANGLAWKFVKWFDSKTQTGTTTAPNGNTNVQYKAFWAAAEFQACIGVGPAQVCNHRTNGVRIWAWANGNYSIVSSTGKPNLPMPRP
jgi:hypothetical protein